MKQRESEDLLVYIFVVPSLVIKCMYVNLYIPPESPEED